MNNNIYKEFLMLTGFEKEEIAEYLPEWIKASKKLGISEEDMNHAVREWLPKHWSINLRGIRKCIGAYIREVIEITKIFEYKQNGIKVVYGSLPANPISFQAIKISGGEKVFVGYPGIHIVTVLGSFFHKTSAFTEKTNKCILNAGCPHCGLTKMRLSAKMAEVIPSPDAIWSWGFNCNEAPKMDEFIHCYADANWKSVYCSLPHDTYLGEIENESQERVKYLALQIEDGQRQIEKITGIKVSEQHFNQALEDADRLLQKVNCLNDLVINADPQPLSGNELSLIEQMITIAFNTGLKYMEEAIDITIEEVRDLIDRKEGILPVGAPKLGCYFVPFCVPWVNGLFLENGVNLSFSTFYTAADKFLEKSSYQDPFSIIAEQWLQMPGSVNIAYEVELNCRILSKYKPDAMLLGFYSFERWVGVHHKIIVNKIEEKMKIPHFYIEGDIWEDGMFRLDDLRTRIETICNFLKMNKMII